MNAIVEAVGAVHDWANEYLAFGYDASGATAQNTSFGHQLWIDFMNIVNIPLAAPWGISELVSPELQPWLNSYYNDLKDKK